MEEYNFGVDAAHVESMLGEFNTSALTRTPTLRWERGGTDEGHACKRAKSLPTARWKTSTLRPKSITKRNSGFG